MAGDWMMIDLELADKPEVHQIAAKLQLDPDIVVGKLIRVWAWFDKQTTDGNARSVNTALVNRLASHNGFAEAMSEAGWLDESKTGLKMPNFDRWNGKSAKKRALAVRRVQRWRDADVNAGSVTKSLPEKRREKNTPLPPSGAFLRFWTAWPKSSRKDSKGECERRWKKHRLDDVADQIVTHVEAMKLTLDWRKDGGAFIPAPLVYLNKRRWEGADPSPGVGETVSPLYRREGVM